MQIADNNDLFLYPSDSNTYRMRNKWNSYIRNARVMGYGNKPSWISRLIDKHDISSEFDNGNHPTTLEFEEKEVFKIQLLQIVEVLNRKYEKNWDLNIKLGPKGLTFLIMIYYEEKPFSNVVEAEYVMKDVLFILKVRWTGILLAFNTDPYLTRTTLLPEEEYEGYRFSHTSLSGRATYSEALFARSCCLGDGDLYHLLLTCYDNFDIERFEFLLYTVDTYLSWESEEGGPYRYRSQVMLPGTSDNIRSLQRNFKDYGNNLLVYLINSRLDVDYYISGNKIKIKNNRKLDSLLKQAYIALSGPEQLKILLVKKDIVSDNYVSLTSEISYTPLDFKNSAGEVPYIYIQGKRLDFKIENLEFHKPVDESVYHIYPKITEYVIERLEQHLWKQVTRGSAIAKYYSRRSSGKSITTD